MVCIIKTYISHIYRRSSTVGGSCNREIGFDPRIQQAYVVKTGTNIVTAPPVLPDARQHV